MGKITDALEKYRKLRGNRVSGQQDMPPAADRAGAPSVTLNPADLDLLRLCDPETRKLDLNQAAIANKPEIVERLLANEIITPDGNLTLAGLVNWQMITRWTPSLEEKEPLPSGEKSSTVEERHAQPSKEDVPDAKPPKSPADGRFDLNKTTARYDKNAIDKNLVLLFNPESIEAEQFKILRTNLLFPIAGAAPRSIMVTSALPGEGKSFVSANLAVSVARHINRSVLLVDCDLRRPSVHQQFGYGETPGLADYLSRGTELPSLLLNTIVEHLTILPAGRPPANPSELLSSERMYDLLEEVSTRYHDRLIIIDSPPPRLAAESSALARQVDGILLVVKYASTPRDIVTELIDKLGPDKVLGAIVNNFEMSSPFYAKKYYGYYGKRYGQK